MAKISGVAAMAAKYQAWLAISAQAA